MGLISCPDCNGIVSEIAPACPHCGRPIAPASTPPPPLDEAKQETVTVKVHGEEIAAPKLSATTQTICIGASPPPPSPVPAAPAPPPPATKPPQLSFLWRCHIHWRDNPQFWFFVFWGVVQIQFIILSFFAPANADLGLGEKLAMAIVGPPVLAFSFMFGFTFLEAAFVAVILDGEPPEVKDAGAPNKPLLGPIASKLVSWTFIGLGIQRWLYGILIFVMVVALIVYAISQALK